MKHIPLRSCIVCRECKDKFGLLRVVKRPDGGIAVDRTGRDAGRGAYVCKSGECIRTAAKKRLFNRAFKQEISQSVYDALVAEFENIQKEGQNNG